MVVQLLQHSLPVISAMHRNPTLRFTPTESTAHRNPTLTNSLPVKFPDRNCGKLVTMADFCWPYWLTTETDTYTDKTWGFNTVEFCIGTVPFPFDLLLLPSRDMHTHIFISFLRL